MSLRRVAEAISFFYEITTPACRNAACTKRFSESKHFGVQARTLRVLAMTTYLIQTLCAMLYALFVLNFDPCFFHCC